MSKKVRYIGAFEDYSGYGEAIRNDIGALLSVGVDVGVKKLRFTPSICDFGEIGRVCNELPDYPDAKIQIVHTTPNLFLKYCDPEKYNIGRVIWETNLLPPDFVNGCNVCDEIWAGCEYTKQAVLDSNVKKKVKVVPESICANLNIEGKYDLDLAGHFVFYSIFEWTDRKNPEALIEAYLKEFENNEKVALVLKTYIDNFDRKKEAQIVQNISQIKKKLFGLNSYAQVYILFAELDKTQIYKFHNSCDCFVSATRGEGWGIPQVEAMLVEKPVITSDCGGVAEFLESGKNALLVEGKYRNINKNNRNQQWYRKEMLWFEVFEGDLRQKMRWVFENRDEAEKIAKEGRKFCKKNFSYESVGRQMLEELKKI